jgi:hypothetical protein
MNDSEESLICFGDTVILLFVKEYKGFLTQVFKPLDLPDTWVIPCLDMLFEPFKHEKIMLFIH